LLVKPGRSKTFRFIGSRNGRQVARKIGHFGQFGVSEARAQAKRLAVDRQAGLLERQRNRTRRWVRNWPDRHLQRVVVLQADAGAEDQRAD
jgi:hypothetical protein